MFTGVYYNKLIIKLDKYFWNDIFFKRCIIEDDTLHMPITP